MKKFLSIALYCVLGLSIAFGYTPISRQRNFVNDANNSIPITASYVDGELNQLVSAANGTLIAQGSTPSSPFEGEFWYNTTSHVLEFYRNNEWILVNPIHSGSVMATPQNNDLWINTVAGQNHIKMYDGINWNDIPIVPKLNGVNWQVPIFNGVNWQDLIVNKGTNWNSTTPILFNGVNWDDPSYSPGTNKSWQYQGFGNTPAWTTVNNWVPTNIQVFTSTGTWTKPSTVSSVYVKVWGDGGGGGGNVGSAVGGGGGAGGYSEGIVSVTGNVTVTIGTGGAGGSGSGSSHSGSGGGGSSFAGTITLTANGGGGGGINTAGTGGSASNGTINITGNSGMAGGSTATIFPLLGAGANSAFGAGQGGYPSGGTGTTSNNGQGYGSGGNGAGNGGTGGNGAPGLEIVYY